MESATSGSVENHICDLPTPSGKCMQVASTDSDGADLNQRLPGQGRRSGRFFRDEVSWGLEHNLFHSRIPTAGSNQRTRDWSNHLAKGGIIWSTLRVRQDKPVAECF